MKLVRKCIAILCLSAFAALFAVPFPIPKVYATTTNAHEGDSATTTDSGADWTNPDNAKADDGVNATVITNYSPSDYLIITDFDFDTEGTTVPSNASIQGVEVILDHSLNAGTVAVNLMHDGAQIGNTKTSSPFGGTSDDWGIGASLTAAVVRSSTFGVRLQVTADDQEVTVDAMTIKVTYADPPTVAMTVSPGQSNAGGGGVCGQDHFVTDASYTMTFTFSESVSGFEIGDIQTSNASVSNFVTVTNTEYTVTVTPTSSGVHSITVPQDAAASTLTTAGNTANTDSIGYYVGWSGCCGVIYTNCDDAKNASRLSGTNSVIVHDNTTGFPVAELSINSTTADATVLSNITISHNSANKRTVLHTAQGHTGLDGSTVKFFVPRVSDDSVTYCKGLTDSDTDCDSSWPNRAVWTNNAGTVTLTSYTGTMSQSEAEALTVTRTTAKDSTCTDQDVWQFEGTITSGGQEGGGAGVPEFTWWSTLMLLIGGGYLIHKLFDEELPLFPQMGF